MSPPSLSYALLCWLLNTVAIASLGFTNKHFAQQTITYTHQAQQVERCHYLYHYRSQDVFTPSASSKRYNSNNSTEVSTVRGKRKPEYLHLSDCMDCTSDSTVAKQQLSLQHTAMGRDLSQLSAPIFSHSKSRPEAFQKEAKSINDPPRHPDLKQAQVQRFTKSQLHPKAC
jgi:hypothetical protein